MKEKARLIDSYCTHFENLLLILKQAYMVRIKITVARERGIKGFV